MKVILLFFYRFCKLQIGIDFKKTFFFIYRLPLYIKNLISFRLSYSGKFILNPCLHDIHEEAGSVQNEYFWQDLVVARFIYKAEPLKHVDIGSRIDGFVSNVASYRDLEVLDIRPIEISIPGVIFKRVDIMDKVSVLENLGNGYCDSLSCLHAIEHFGLGRYGDPIDSDGFRKGLENMINILDVGGSFYLSTPLGVERVEFNANRVFDPREIIKICNSLCLKLKEFYTFTPENKVEVFTPDNKLFEELSRQHYRLGIFIFTKIQN